MKKYFSIVLVLLVLVGMPSFVFAQDGCDPTVDFGCWNPDWGGNTNGGTSGGSNSVDTCDSGSLGGFFCKIGELLNSAIPVLVALGVVYFVYGVVTYVINDDEEAKQKGRDRILYGVIGLAVILSLWGLVYLVLNTFDISGDTPTSAELKTLLPK
jgi:hypothetical protein